PALRSTDMAMDTETIVVAPAMAGTEEHHSYLDWPAVIGGIVLASAISLLLLAFGSAVGLSFADFDASDDVNPIWIAIAAALWLLWVQISSFMAGGYVTGRLRRRFNDATEHESDVRDGVHGLLVWGGALVLGAIIAVGGIGAAVSAVGNAVGTATIAASNVAGDAAEGMDPNAYFVDTLFRAPAGATPAAGSLQDFRGEATRILANGALAGTVSDTDKAYLAQIVSANTGLTPDEANARVNEVLTAVETAKAEAAAAAETARKWTVLGAFLTAASLLVSGVGAYWAAMKGGNHRDKQTVVPGFGRF
ncbi:MAG: hypothetical protein ABIY37_13870, partial [Devosia sp.]